MRSLPLRLGLLLLLVGLGGLAGCLAASPRNVCAATATRLVGSWDALLSAEAGAGTQRIDRHELQIYASGATLVGFWDQAIAWRSQDSRPFTCGGARQLQISRRLHFAGTAHPGHAAVLLRVMPWRGPSCAPRPTAPAEACRLELAAASALTFRCGAQHLRLQPRLSQRIPFALSWRKAGTVTGIWTWTHRSEDTDGDRKLEEETWHLRQQGDQISGHYDRLVQVRSGDGRHFQCNGRLHYESRARFWVQGTAMGRDIQLRELRYTTAPSPCEPGKRSLDSYSGKLQRNDQTLELSWGSGLQQLTRRY